MSTRRIAALLTLACLGALGAHPVLARGIVPPSGTAAPFAADDATDWTGGVTPASIGAALDQLADRLVAAIASHVTDLSGLTYTPAVATDWTGDADPGGADDAMDQAASRIDAVEIVAAAAQVGTDALTDWADVGVVGAADLYPYSTGAGVWAYGTVTAAGRALLDDATALAQLSTLGLSATGIALVSGLDAASMRTTLELGALATGATATDVPYTPAVALDWTDPDPTTAAGGIDAAGARLTTLEAVSSQPLSAALTDLDDVGVVSAADLYHYSTGIGVWAEGTATAAGRALLDDATAAAQLTTLGVTAAGAALLDDVDAAAQLTTLGVTAAGQALLDDASAAAQLTTLGVTAAGQALLDDAAASDQRTTLGLGALATGADSSGVPISTCALDADWDAAICPATAKAADDQLAERVADLEGAGGGAASGLTVSVTQTTHGFAVGDVLQQTGVGWAKAQADSLANALWQGVVSSVEGVDDFTITLGGQYSGVALGYMGNTWYYLDPTTPGAVTDTEPSPPNVSAPVLFALDGNTAIVVNHRPSESVGADGLAYTPAVTTDWTGDADPGDVDNALDQLAERVDDVEIVAAAAVDAANVTYTPAVGVDPGDVADALDGLRNHRTPQVTPSVAPTAVWHPNDESLEMSGSTAFALVSGGTYGHFRGAGKTVTRFNGATKYDLGTDLGFPLNYTFIMAIRFDLLAAMYVQASGPTGGANDDVWGGLGLESTGALTYYFGDNTSGSYGSTTSNPITAKTWHVITMRYTAGQTAPLIRVDGADVATTPGSTAASAAGGNGTSTFRIGHLGAYTAGSNMTSLLGDWYFWNSALGDADRDIVEGALMAAYQ